VQPKAVAFPTDAKLMHRARERLVRLAKKTRIALRQSYERVVFDGREIAQGRVAA
jgi:IS5 family transposase